MDTENKETPAAACSLLAYSSQQHYTSDLFSFTVDRLQKEVDLLHDDADRIKTQMEEIMEGNYREIIAVTDVLLVVGEEMVAMDKHLQFLIDEIPQLASGFAEFTGSTGHILEERKMNQMLLENHSTLLDLLEIPQLMDTFMNDGNYDEALQLDAFVCVLSTIHPKLPLVQAVAAEARQATKSLLAQLLQKLRTDIQLPEQLQIIGYLRQTGVFSEYELRLQFLRCREARLAGILEDLDQKNAYKYLTWMINSHRIHIFDVVKQYRAVFYDDKSESEEYYDRDLLFSWAMHQITSHLKTLKLKLPEITDGVTLSSILDSCMFCAAGLNMVGLDFRGLLPSIFEDAVLILFSKKMSVAVENFQLALDAHCWVPHPAISASSAGDEDENVTPPSQLLEHPPLAVFVNCVSAAMNELRPCAPISIKFVLAEELIKGLEAVSDALLRYNASKMLGGKESVLFLSLCESFIEVAYPHCATCFGHCYPGGAAIITNRKCLYDGIGRLLATSSSG